MKKIFLLCFAAAVLSSCAALVDAMQADDRVKRVEVGMTEREVIGIMGGSYQVVGADGDMRVIAYGTDLAEGGSATAEYRFYFRGGRLQSFEKERINQHQPHRPDQPHRPHRPGRHDERPGEHRR